MGKDAKARHPDRVAQAQMDRLLDRYSGCLESDGAFRDHLKHLRQEWPSKETSADAILERAGARRMSTGEFDKHFDDLPTDGEG